MLRNRGFESKGRRAALFSVVILVSAFCNASVVHADGDLLRRRGRPAPTPPQAPLVGVPAPAPSGDVMPLDPTRVPAPRDPGEFTPATSDPDEAGQGWLRNLLRALHLIDLQP